MEAEGGVRRRTKTERGEVLGTRKRTLGQDQSAWIVFLRASLDDSAKQTGTVDASLVDNLGNPVKPKSENQDIPTVVDKPSNEDTAQKLSEEFSSKSLGSGNAADEKDTEDAVGGDGGQDSKPPSNEGEQEGEVNAGETGENKNLAGLTDEELVDENKPKLTSSKSSGLAQGNDEHGGHDDGHGHNHEHGHGHGHGGVEEIHGD